MITGEDIDRCIMQQFEADLQGLSDYEAQELLDEVEEEIDTKTAWAEALSAYLRSVS